jgi:hypothetical protein
MRTFTRYAFRIAAAVLTLGILVIGTFLVLVAVPDLTGGNTAVKSSPKPSVQPSPSSRSAMSPVGIEMPADADCNGCHMTTTGTVGTKQPPVMGHPLAGWRECTACHSVGSLVKTAPGHSSLHKDDCLICHQTRVEAGASDAPKSRPEHMGGTQACTTCHGVDDHAPLPESMKGRGDNCWICHNGPEYTYLFEDRPSPSPSPEWTTPAPGSGAPASPVTDPDDVGYVLQPPTP